MTLRHTYRTLLFSMTLPLLVLGFWAGTSGEGAHFWRGEGRRPVALKPTQSAPLALTQDDRYLWVVNPANHSVSLLEVGNDANRKLTELRVGREPRCLAITPNDRKVYVTNMASGTVAVIDALQRRILRFIPVGAEPFGCALTPDGKKLYVTNFSSDSVSVIDTATDSVLTTIEDVGPKPRGIAINTDGKVYVTQFLAQLREDGRSVEEREGRDDGKEGRLTVLSSATESVLGTAILEPVTNTGFWSNGSTLDKIPPTDPPTPRARTGAFPNLLQGLAFKKGRLYLPNTGASPNGPARFDVNVQSLLCVLDTTTDTDTGFTLNMNRGVPFEVRSQRLFPTNPLAIAFENGADEGYVVSAATNRLVKVVLDAEGRPTINAPRANIDPGNIVRIEVGKNPQGIVINTTDTRAYVMNALSRDVSVVNLTTETEIARIASAALPNAGTLEATLHRGQELFVTSIGPTGDSANVQPPAGRMSESGWGSCYSCHPEGRSDGVTWLLADGPRQTLSLESVGEHPQPTDSALTANGAPHLPAFKQRVLDWSAVRDEVQDFEGSIRNLSGGQGLITDGEAVTNLLPRANTGRSADLDALAAYCAMGIRAPLSPYRLHYGGNRPLPVLAEGRALFAAAHCQRCHGGPNWTRSRVDFAPPPSREPLVEGQLTRFLFSVGTFHPDAPNELRPDLSVAHGALGYNIPSLLSVFASAPYLHSGSAPTLGEVLNNVTHRSAGTGGRDTLRNPIDRAKLVIFLRSIDAKTPRFP